MPKNNTEQQEFSCSINVNVPAGMVFDAICRVQEWWTKDVEGDTKNLNSEFTIRFGTTWKLFRITAFEPNTKIVWLVIDSYLPWNTDIHEWTNTQIVWELAQEGDSTTVKFSHIGLAQLNCGNMCMNIWTGYIQKSLFQLITEGTGSQNDGI